MYLVHSPLSKVLIGPRIPAPTDGWSYAGISVLMFAATLLAALAFAVVADTVVLKPVQRLLRNVDLPRKGRPCRGGRFTAPARGSGPRWLPWPAPTSRGVPHTSR